jgi:hypothetical protein
MESFNRKNLKRSSTSTGIFLTISNGVLEDNIVGISFFAPVSGTENDEAPWYVQYLQRVDFEHSREDQRQYSEIKRVLYGH